MDKGQSSSTHGQAGQHGPSYANGPGSPGQRDLYGASVNELWIGATSPGGK